MLFFYKRLSKETLQVKFHNTFIDYFIVYHVFNVKMQDFPQRCDGEKHSMMIIVGVFLLKTESL